MPGARISGSMAAVPVGMRSVTGSFAKFEKEVPTIDSKKTLPTRMRKAPRETAVDFVSCFRVPRATI